MKIKLRGGCRDKGRTRVGYLQSSSIAHGDTIISLVRLMQGKLLKFWGDMVVSTTVKIPWLFYLGGVWSVGSQLNM